MKKIEAISSEHEQRLSHLEGYTRRWNLRVYGIPEKEREDVRERVIQVCQQLLPEAKDKLPYTVDTVHRLGVNKRAATSLEGSSFSSPRASTVMPFGGQRRTLLISEITT